MKKKKIRKRREREGKQIGWGERGKIFGSVTGCQSVPRDMSVMGHSHHSPQLQLLLLPFLPHTYISALFFAEGGDRLVT